MSHTEDWEILDCVERVRFDMLGVRCILLFAELKSIFSRYIRFSLSVYLDLLHQINPQNFAACAMERQATSSLSFLQ